ncbi:MAG: hypothetical protein LC714_09245, partial [Actinobacteria bacterium]|nr:hypothetical protein [Actinomycetota bacterium]
VALLPGEPAGKIATCTAGAIEFGATLAWRSREDVPPEPIFLELHDAARCSIAVAESPEAATRRLAGEIRSFTQAELAAALEAALRAVTTVAALTEAMLEVDAVRTVPPGVASPRALEELARDLWDAGFTVRFGPSWTPAPGAEVCVGTDGDLQEFLRAHPSWSVA